jgi:hypothetical protein
MSDQLHHVAHDQQQQQQQQHGPLQPLVHAATQYTPPSGVKKTFYKRKLPCPPATEFSSAAGARVSSHGCWCLPVHGVRLACTAHALPVTPHVAACLHV